MYRVLLLSLVSVSCLATPVVAQDAYDIINRELIKHVISANERKAAESKPDDVEFSGGFGLRTGYDSNYDLEEDSGSPEGSGFASFSINGEIKRRSGPVSVFADGDAELTVLQYEGAPIRADASGRAGSRLTLGNLVLEVALGDEIDATDDPILNISNRVVAAQILSSIAALGLRLGYEETRPIAALSRLSSFDPLDGATNETSLDATFVLLPESSIAPFVDAGLRRLTSLDSDAASGDFGDDHTMVTARLGLRVTAIPNVILLAGLRLNRRVADDPTVGTLEALSPELDAEWRFLEDWKLSAGLMTELNAPTQVASAGQDTTEARAELKYDPAEGFGTKLKASLEVSQEVGLVEPDTRLKTEASLHYRWAGGFVAEALLSRTVTSEDVDTETINRLILSGGLDKSF